MKKLGMILSMTAILGSTYSCTQEDLEEQIAKAQEKSCSINFEEELEDFEQRSQDGTLEVGETAPRACEKLVAEPESSQITINIEMRNFKDEQVSKMNEALEKVRIVINSAEFKDRIIAHTYKGDKTFVQNDDLSNEEVYEKIMIGAETLNLEEDQEMDIDVTMYYKNNSTIGYTYPNTPKTWVNSKFFNRNSHAQIAKNIVHEWTHKLGFEHDFKRTSRRPYSVPYAVGTIIEDLIDEL
jgi:hypothetical protein